MFLHLQLFWPSILSSSSPSSQQSALAASLQCREKKTLQSKSVSASAQPPTSPVLFASLPLPSHHSFHISLYFYVSLFFCSFTLSTPQPGRPNIVTGFQTMTSPVVLQAGQRVQFTDSQCSLSFLPSPLSFFPFFLIMIYSFLFLSVKGSHSRI